MKRPNDGEFFDNNFKRQAFDNRNNQVGPGGFDGPDQR